MVEIIKCITYNNLQQWIWFAKKVNVINRRINPKRTPWHFPRLHVAKSISQASQTFFFSVQISPFKLVELSPAFPRRFKRRSTIGRREMSRRWVARSWAIDCDISQEPRRGDVPRQGACATPASSLLAGDDVMQSPLSLWYHLRAFLQSTLITRAA